MTGKRHWYLWAGLAYLVIIAVVSLGLLGLYNRSGDRLDEALGDRLQAVAGSLAVLVDADIIFNFTIGDSSGAVFLDLLEADFLQLARQGDLAEITLCDPDGVVLASSSRSLTKGKVHGFWDLDRPAVEQALGGTSAVTSLYRLQSTFQKSAHVPVIKEDSFGEAGFVVGIITVSGNPDFFASLGRLRSGALITGGVVLLILVFMGVFLHRINLSLERYRATMLQQENLAAMGRMTAGIAHEIRNPLGIIRGSGQHLQRILEEAGIDDPVAGFIPEEVDRLDAILSGYLAFGSDSVAEDEVFDLAPVVRRGVGLMEDELRHDGIEVTMTLTDSVQVTGDQRRLQQVLLNLLLNARDAMPDGGELTLDLKSKDGWAILEVIDQGQGLAGASLDQLFEPFFTTKEKGSGLGLAMSRRIIEDGGGTLELTPGADGLGAVARIKLPVESADRTER